MNTVGQPNHGDSGPRMPSATAASTTSATADWSRCPRRARPDWRP